MKKLYACLLVGMVSITTYAQESMEQVMEKRAREMHRVIDLTDKEEWRKFIKENYTQALIDKPMRATVKEMGSGASSEPSEVKNENNMEAKVNMFDRLHNDFGGSKISSIKSSGNILNMTLDTGTGLMGNFELKFEKNKPFLIDGLGIRAEN